MPILEYHLAEGQYSDAQIDELLLASSELYASVLQSPVERVRVFANMHPKRRVAVGGKLMNDGAGAAPYFHCLVLQGRSEESCHALLAGFTDLLVRILGADKASVRGGCWPIAPSMWSIGGVPASQARAAEIRARAN